MACLTTVENRAAACQLPNLEPGDTAVSQARPASDLGDRLAGGSH